jgi:hypothetical protein
MRILSFQKAAPLALAAILTFAVSIPAAAQGNGMRSNGSIALHGMPPSVTSFGFGGRPGFHGVPPSVTSFGFGGRPGFHGIAPNVTSQNFGSFPLRTDHGIRHHQGQFFSHRHRGNRFVSPFYSDVIAVPYAYPFYMTDSGLDDYDSMNDAAVEEDQDNDRGGPTIFDRRGPGAGYDSAPERDKPGRSEEDYRTAAPAPAPPPEIAEQPSTVLVFKDGRRLEISNYAIAGSTLYNLSDGLPRKVALAEIDLPATVKQNDDRGVDFQIPEGTKPN